MDNPCIWSLESGPALAGSGSSFRSSYHVPEPLVQNFEKEFELEPELGTGQKSKQELEPAARLQLEPNPERKATAKPSLSRFQL
jgi:hypothetical protein